MHKRVAAYEAKRIADPAFAQGHRALDVICMTPRRGFSDPPSCGCSLLPHCIGGTCQYGGRIVRCSWAPDLEYQHDEAVARLDAYLQKAMSS